MTVLLTVQGFEANTVMSEFLGGELNPGRALPTPLADFAPVTEVRQVKYSWLTWALTQGMNNLDAAIKAVPVDQQIITLGHSNGETIISMWLNQKAATTTVDLTRLAFVTLGNDDMERLPELGALPCRVIDALRQYDAGDKPNVTSSPYYQQAVTNQQLAGVHVNGYKDISLSTPNWVSQRGNITFQLHRTEPAINETWENIESAYNRPLFGPLV